MTPEPDKIVGGKYRLEKPLARGGMGSVWLARHTELDSPVAVKFMAHELVGTPVAEARFKREAKAAAQLRSPNVVSIQDYGVEDGAPYMVMELLDGEDLSTLLARVGRLSIARVAAITLQVAKALALAHAAGIVHRDLKPSNLFLARAGEDESVKVLDFGVAKETRSMLVVDKTTSGVLVGSPMYMSPEQARGEPLDFRSDLWSLGVLVYEALVGRPPFVSDHLGALLAKIHEARVEPPTSIQPDLPEAIDVFTARALARQPEARFPSARAMADELAAIAQGSPGTLAAVGAQTAATGPGDEAPRAGAEEPARPFARIVVGRSDDTLPANEADPVSTTMHERPATAPPEGAARRRSLVPLAIGVALIGGLAIGWFGLGRGQDTAASADADGDGAASSASAPGTASAPARNVAEAAPAATSTMGAGPAQAASAPLVEPAPASARPGVAPAVPSVTAAPSASATAKPRASTGPTASPAAPIKTAAPLATAAPAVTTAKPAYDPTFGLPSKAP